MPWKLERSARAVDDLLVHYAYIANDNPDAAERFFDAAERLFAHLTNQPMLGRGWDSARTELAGVRLIPLPQPFGNYLVFYRPGEHVVSVLAVLHAARDLPSLLH